MLLPEQGILFDTPALFFTQSKTLILASTYPLVEGTNILENKGLGPIRKEARKLEAYLIEDYKAYAFGSIDVIDESRQRKQVL